MIPLDLLPRLANAAVGLDPETRDLLATLSGRQILVQVKGTALRFACRMGTDGQWHAADAGGTPPADLVVRLSVSALLALLLGTPPDDLAGYRALGIELEGDLAIARVLQEAWLKFQVDLEEPVSRIAGDVVARHVGNLGRGAGRSAREIRVALLRATSEQLQYQLALLPGKPEVEQWMREVDELRDRADRLQARIEMLGIDRP